VAAYGGFAEEVVADATAVIPVPDSIDFDKAFPVK
jgi:D-arabinose 1-dehydrogenase-like Zn-dependent alcohol dehydrogenase